MFRRRHKQRLRRNELLGFSGFVVVLVPVGLLGLVFAVARVTLDRAIGILGTLLAVSTVALSQYQSRRSRTRRVVFLAKSRSSFARNIYRGLTDGLASFGDIQVTGAFPDPGIDVAEWQVEQLRSITLARADALVLIPASDHEPMWRDVGRILRRGTFVVCLDTKPPNQAFRNHGLDPPLFVGSDFTIGGHMLGKFLSEQLLASPGSRLVLALGPETSWPARERVSWILYELARADLLNRCDPIHLRTWDVRDGVSLLLPAVEHLIQALPQKSDLEAESQVFVFAGNDKLAAALDTELARHHLAARASVVRIVGYDGTTTDDGEQVLTGLDHCLATVDTLPREQGAVAAEFIAWAYEGHPYDLTKRVVTPRLVKTG